MTGFESIQVRFKHTKHIPSPFADTREVPFVDSYLTVLRSIIDDVNTEYFWFFSNFMDLKTIDLDYIPEQHEQKQIHVWYNTHVTHRCHTRNPQQRAGAHCASRI